MYDEQCFKFFLMYVFTGGGQQQLHTADEDATCAPRPPQKLAGDVIAGVMSGNVVRFTLCPKCNMHNDKRRNQNAHHGTGATGS